MTVDEHKGHRERLRARFKQDLGVSMADYELLELFLTYSISRKDVKPIAKSLLKRFKTLPGVIGASMDQLTKVKGVGSSTALFFKVIQAGTILATKTEMKKGNILKSYDSLIEYCTVQMAHKDVEQFRVIFLDMKNCVILDEEQTRGTVSETSIYPREIVRRALEINAVSLILVHNHPSGDPTPSQNDIDTTNFIQKAVASLEISVHDHIIVGKENVISFKALGLL